MDLPSLIRLGGYVLANLSDLPGLLREDSSKIASKRLRNLVKYAYDNVSLYRQKYDAAGVRPDDIQSIADLDKLPIITKSDLIDGFPQSILSAKVKNGHYRILKTSGSTGVPLKVYKDRSFLGRSTLGILSTTTIFRRHLKIKLRPGMLLILVTSEDSLEQVMVSEMSRLPRFLTRHHHWLDALSDPEIHLHSLAQYRPDIVFTYPSVLKNIARVAMQKGIEVYQPKVLILSGEVLDEKLRQEISTIFTGEIVNYYATTEAGLIAMECRCHNGLHVLSPNVVVELLQDGKPVSLGKPGSVTVTDLSNRATPIIRYSGLGDVASFNTEACPCGSRQPLLKMVNGRVTNSIVLPDGRLIHPFSLTLALESIPLVAGFQIIQESVDRLRTLIVASKAATPDENGQLQDEILQRLKQILGENIDICVELVKEITGNGVVRSLVEEPVLGNES